jgi:hypothetical protein
MLHQGLSNLGHSCFGVITLFDTKMSMTCLHKGHTMKEEIEISVVLLDE